MRSKKEKNFYYREWFKLEKMACFLFGGMRDGYGLTNTWDLMLNSKQGRGILEEDYVYVIRQEGYPSYQDAIQEHGNRYKKLDTVRIYKLDELRLLAEFIERITERYNLEYEDLFRKMSLDDFMAKCGYALGNYDVKLYEIYLKEEKS